MPIDMRYDISINIHVQIGVRVQVEPHQRAFGEVSGIQRGKAGMR